MGSQESMIVPIWITIRFQQRVRQDSQNLNDDTFLSLLVTSAQCAFGTGEQPNSGILLNYDDDAYSQAYGQIKEVSEALTKDDLL